MLKAFAGLAVSHLLLLLATAGLGLFSVNFGQQRHVLLAVGTVILGCLIQVVVFTYLTVTFKLMGQLVHLAKLDLRYVTQAKALKRRTARLLGVVVLTTLAVGATGAVRWSTGSNQLGHILAAIIALAGNSVAYFVEFDVIYRNAQLLTQVIRAHERFKAGDIQKAPAK